MAGKIRVLYFAAIKDVTNKEFEEVDIQTDDWSLLDLSESLTKKYGTKMGDFLSISMYAVNMEYVEKEQESTTILIPNSEIAIIPPVSGG